MRKSDEERARIQQRQADIAAETEYKAPGFTFDEYADGHIRFGGAAPWQAWGHYHGRSCYLRFRHNQASMTVYDREAESDDDCDHEQTAILSSVIYPYYPEGHPEHHVHTPAPLADDVPVMVRRLVDELAPVSEENPTSVMLLARAVDELLGRTRD